MYLIPTRCYSTYSWMLIGVAAVFTNSRQTWHWSSVEYIFFCLFLYFFIFVIYDPRINCIEKKNEKTKNWRRTKKKEKESERERKRTDVSKMTTMNIYMYLYINVNMSSEFSSIGIKWCSIKRWDKWIRIGWWRISWRRSTDLLLRIIKWSSACNISCSSSWMHTYGWWTSSCRDCRRINIKTRILFFPFCSSILKP